MTALKFQKRHFISNTNFFKRVLQKASYEFIRVI